MAELSQEKIKMIDQRVAVGAAILDQIFPGWEDQVTKPIDMNSTDRDILGQIYGSLAEGCRRLEKEGIEKDTELVEKGFVVLGGTVRNNIDDCFLLKRAWAREALDRLLCRAAHADPTRSRETFENLLDKAAHLPGAHI